MLKNFSTRISIESDYFHTEYKIENLPIKNATFTFATIKLIISYIISLSLLKLLVTKIIFIQQTIKVGLKNFKNCKEEHSKKI